MLRKFTNKLFVDVGNGNCLCTLWSESKYALSRRSTNAINIYE